MKAILFYFALIITSFSYSQSFESDITLLRSKIESQKNSHENHVNSRYFDSNAPVSKAPLKNNCLKKQLLSDCKFQTNCTAYCKQSFGRFGIIKGLFISVDRLLRCDRITSATASPYRKTVNGKMIDYLEEYGKE